MSGPLLSAASSARQTIGGNFIGLYFSVASIIVVYHLFLLQTWLQRVVELESQTSDVEMNTGVGDFARERVRRRCADHLRLFPWMQVGLLAVAIGILASLGGRLAIQIDDVPLIYSLSPIVVLVGVFVSATGITWLDGSGRLYRARERLE